MELVFQAIIIVVIAAAAAATVYKTVPGMALLLSIAAALLALLLCIGLLEPLAAFFRDAIALSGLSGVYTERERNSADTLCLLLVPLFLLPYHITLIL